MIVCLFIYFTRDKAKDIHKINKESFIVHNIILKQFILQKSKRKKYYQYMYLMLITKLLHYFFY